MRYLPVLILVLVPLELFAGVHYSGESFNELPSHWRGFLLDHRSLRMIGTTPNASTPVHFLRQQYQNLAENLEKQAKLKPLSADQLADLGAIYLRLNLPSKSLDVLRTAQRSHPEHFRIVSNLGTAWQLSGDLAESARVLTQAVRLAPPIWKKFEEAQLSLVQARQREMKNNPSVDNIFGNLVIPANKEKLPTNDVASVQQLALWLPSDGRVLWLLGELAYTHGDVRIAASLLEGCVSEYTLASPECRKNRQRYRQEADEINQKPDSEHAKFRGDIRFKSNRPLIREFDLTALPEIRPDGTNQIPWPVLNETTIQKPFQPKFLKYLHQLDGKKVAITGFMQPVSMEAEVSGFMVVEYPVGCWFCETPEPAGIIFADMGEGKTAFVKRERIKITGTLKLNSTDPEDFLYTIQNARISAPD